MFSITTFCLFFVFSPGQSGSFEVFPDSGYIDSYDDIDTLQVSTNESPVFLKFSWKSEMNLWARVYGEDARFLAEVNLEENPVIKLKGGGVFLIELYSESDFGWWKCVLINKSQYKRDVSD